MNRPRPAYRQIPQPQRVWELFDHRNPGTIYLAALHSFLIFLWRHGLKPKEDGWRKYATAFHKTEDCRFALALFRLNTASSIRGNDVQIGTKQWVILRLAQFFKEHQPLCRTRLVWQRRTAHIQANHHLDIVWAEFDPDGYLERLQPLFDADQDLSFAHASHPGAQAFIQAYNQTRYSGRQRPYQLMSAVRKALQGSSEARAGIEFAQRVLDSIFVHFEDTPPDQRLEMPDFSTCPHPGGGAFNILCRLQPDGQEADLWFHVHHALQDGNPVLEALGDLRKQWGVRGDLIYPPPAQSIDEYRLMQPEFGDSGRDLVYVQMYLSFERLLEARARLNAKYSHVLEKGITVAGMILWGLAGQPFFRDAKLVLAVDVPAGPGPGEPRSLGAIIRRPGDFLDGNDRELSFISYQAHLNRAIEAVKAREDLAYALLQCEALTPVAFYERTLAMLPGAIREISGQVNLTMMPLAEWCAAAPDAVKEMAIAIGNFLMPMEGGLKGGVVSINAPKQMALQCQQAVYNAITQWQI